MFNFKSLLSVWGTAPPRPPAHVSAFPSAPLPQKSSYASAYDGLTGKYGFYFPCDKQTVYMLEDDKDIRFVEW